MNKDYRKLTELRNWDKNPRSIKKDKFEELKKRITRRGQIKPLIITPDGEVLGGNMRLRAMQELGIKEAWVSVVEPTSEADKIEIALTDNEEMGYYEDQALAELIAQYKDEIDLSKYSVHLKEPQTLEEILKQFSPDEVVEDEAPEVTEEAISKLGEVYQLGRHRVMCGDSTKIEDVEKLMDGRQSDAVFTDPPYNVAVNDESVDSLNDRNRRTDGLKVSNDNMSDDDFNKFLLDCFTNYYMTLKDGGVIYVCYADSMTIPFLTQFKNVGFHFAQNCIWNKQQFVMTRKDYHYKHEPIIYGWKKGEAHNWYTDRKQSSVWNFDRPFKSELHPTMKPISLVTYAVNNSTKSGDLVSDLFLGSGSTLIACEQTNRICYGMELDPKYVDVIRKRYTKFIDPDNWESKWVDITPETDI